jgi:hypothetical protein
MDMKGVAVANRDDLMQRFASALDAIPSEVLADAELDEVERAGVRVAAYHFIPGGKVTNLSSAGNGCPTKTILDVAGWSVTGANGTVEVRLNNYHCGDQPLVTGGSVLGFETPIHLVATARSGNIPCFVTVQTELDTTGDNDDIIIRLFSWNAGGNPLGGIRVQWRCMVPTFRIMD